MPIEQDLVFHGHLGELYQLAKDGKIPTTLQGSHTRPCKFWTAMKILSGIRNSVVLAHGPSGCAYGVKQAYKLTNSRNSGSPYESVLTTGVDMENVVFGGEKILKKAILEAQEKYRPDLIAVATSCATGIIGDNVDSVVDGSRSQVGARLLPVHCEGFAGEYRTGFDLVFRQVVDLMKQPTPESKAALSRHVNILGAKMGPERTEVETDVVELVRLVEGMGARINAVIAGNCSLEELERAPSAAVNCALCMDLGAPIGKAMQERFGTPLNSTILPYGIAATKQWLRGAAEKLGLEAECEDLLRREHEAIREEYEEALAKLDGKTALIEGHDAVKSLSVAHMLEADFGMRAVIYNFHPWSTEARETSIDYLLETGLDPEVLITKGTLAFGKYESMKQTEEEMLRFLGDLDPASTVYFGSSLAFPTVPVVDLNAILNRPRFGFRGALKVARCVVDSIRYSGRGRSRLAREMVYPRSGGLHGGASLTPKLAQDLPDCTVYAGARKRGGKCAME